MAATIHKIYSPTEENRVLFLQEEAQKIYFQEERKVEIVGSRAAHRKVMWVPVDDLSDPKMFKSLEEAEKAARKKISWLGKE